MTDKNQAILSDSKTARWTALAIVSLTMFAGYFIADVMSPLQDKLAEVLSWEASDFGLFNGAYAWFNVFLFFLIFGGFILDKKGVRFTGIMSIFIMILGTGMIYWAINTRCLDGQSWHILLWTFRAQVWLASVGYAVFGVGIEIAGITTSKIVVKWFKGRSLAFAMGMQLSVARLGTSLAMSAPLLIISYTGKITSPLFYSLVMLGFGLIAFIIFSLMDKRLDDSIAADNVGKNMEPEEEFHIKDFLIVIKNKAWWYISILCVLFYSAVFPFLKFSTNLLTNKFGVDANYAGAISGLLPFGCILLTPIFGGIYDRKGKGATIMIIGAFIIFFAHLLFALPFITNWYFAVILVIMIGISFSLVPCAMWPSVSKIIPDKQLGSAYAGIFWLQNLVALFLLPTAMGFILEKYCITAYNGKVPIYDYSLPMLIFMSLGVLAVVFAFLLKAEDKKKGYGLELPNAKN
ncbi:MAG: MFS transporter [Bacteroidales bacterium]|jgi:MFS family permease